MGPATTLQTDFHDRPDTWTDRAHASLARAAGSPASDLCNRACIMRVLISTAGSHGDVLPFIALSREFAARGHEAVLYANPYFRDCVTDPAIRFVPVGTAAQHRALMADLSDGNPNRAFRRVAQALVDLCPRFHAAMRADVVPGDTVAIGSSILFAARLLRETDGVPCATIHLAPSIFRSNVRPARLVPNWITARTPALFKQAAWWLLDRAFYDPIITTPFNRHRAALGLPPVERIFRGWVHEADCVLGLFPDWFGEPQDDWPSGVRLTGFPLFDQAADRPPPAPLEAFLADGPPPVAFSAGTATASAGRFFETSVAAAQAAGLRAILLTPFSGHLPPRLPDGVMAVDYAPFGTLLPRVAAFVHHGGIGSTSQALRAGVPQLIRPSAYDQFDNADRAVRLGVAKEILPRRYAPEAVSAALEDMLADAALSRRCSEIAARLVGNETIGKACDTLLDRLGPLASAGRFASPPAENQR